MRSLSLTGKRIWLVFLPAFGLAEALLVFSLWGRSAYAQPVAEISTTCVPFNGKFGRVPVGSESPVHETSLYVTGLKTGQTATVLSVSIEGKDPGDFAITNNGCHNFVFTQNGCQNQNCVISVAFQPQASGLLKAALAAVLENSAGQKSTPTAAMNGIGGIIIQPADGKNISISSANPYNSAPVQFQAAGVGSGATVHWKTVLRYQTSGKVPATPASATLSFPTTGGGQVTRTYTSEGGQLTVSATVGTLTDKVTAYITGPPLPPGIPDTTISAELRSLYAAGASPDLLCQIAHKESSYAQFAEETLYKVGSLWPYESPPVTGHPAGSYIGLMQDKLVANGYKPAMETAWDWIDNAEVGYDIIESKIPIVQKLQSYAQRTYKGLPDLTPVQVENMSLGLYSGNAKPPPLKCEDGAPALATQYYYPTCLGGTGSTCDGGAWQWQINQKQNKCAVGTVNYVNSVRIQPGC